MVTLDPTAPLIVVAVTVEGPRGSAEVEMALDTASTFVVIPGAVAREVGYPLSGSEPNVELHTATSPQTAPLVTLLGVKAIGVRVGLVEAACRELPAEGPVKGLLGLSFLRHLDLDLHFRSGRLSARGPGPRRPGLGG